MTPPDLGLSGPDGGYRCRYHAQNPHPASTFLLVLPLAVFLLWYEIYSVRRKVRELQATVTNAKTLKREQEMVLANTIRRVGTYVLAFMVSVSFLLRDFGFIADRTGIGLIWAWVFVTVVMIFWYGVKGAPAWLWRWLVQRPPE